MREVWSGVSVSSRGCITAKDIADLLVAIGKPEAARIVLFADLINPDRHFWCAHRTQPCRCRGPLAQAERARAERLHGSGDQEQSDICRSGA